MKKGFYWMLDISLGYVSYLRYRSTTLWLDIKPRGPILAAWAARY
jgi:hypothetical protein